MLKRAATALVLGPLVVWAVWKGPGWLVAVMVGLVTGLSLLEYFSIGKKLGANGYGIWTMVCSAGLLIICSGSAFFGGMQWGNRGEEVPYYFLIVGFVFVAGCALGAIAGPRGPREAVAGMGLSIGGFFMIAVPLATFVLIHRSDKVIGPILALFVLALVWAGDILGYLVGKGMGRHLMAPVISPKKTWEGAAANFVGSVAVAWPFAKWMGVELAPLLVVAGVANVAGQVGDLVESAYKRSAGVKDSGGLLPGHGGMLDRIDALLFALPVVYACVLLTILFATP